MPRNDLKAYASLIARMPQDLVDQVKRYAREHRCTISELIRDGLEMRLETDLPWHAPGQSPHAKSEVLPEVLPDLEALTPMLRVLVQDTVRATMAEVLHEVLPYSDQVLPGHTSTLQAPSGSPKGGMTEVFRKARRGMTTVIPSPAPTVLAGSKGLTEVLPPSEAKHRGRPPVLREPILALLREYPNGLTAAQLKVYLGTEKHIGDTLAGMVRAELLVKDGSGKAVRYLLAVAVEAPGRP